MFAPKAAQSQTKQAESPANSRLLQRPVLAGQLQATPEHFAAGEGELGTTWDFSRISALASHRPSQVESPHTAPTPGPTARDVSGNGVGAANKALWRHAAGGHSSSNVSENLTIGDINDPLEVEADRVANQIMRMPAGGVAAPVGRAGPVEMRRACAKCEEEDVLHRVEQPGAGGAHADAAGLVGAALNSGAGKPLDPGARAFFEPRFGQDLSMVRVFNDQTAAASARAVDARAYAMGRDVVFGAGEYTPNTSSGRWLLAHELTHVLQHNNGAGAGKPALRRAPPEKLGTKVTEPAGAPSPIKSASATFDGDKFKLVGDGKSLVEASGQSGHPNQVDAAEVTACKGGVDDSYLNNPRYVGIKDKGAIPEGSYTFRHSNMVQFSANEQRKMSLASPGEYADPSGLDLHGDWGAGRVALSPVTIKPSPFCGNTAARSGFYLHGGIMTGSSGCIDIGNSGITDVVDKLMGYTRPVPVTVKYTAPVPSTNMVQRAAGRFMYPENKDTSMWGRIKSVFGGK